MNSTDPYASGQQALPSLRQNAIEKLRLAVEHAQAVCALVRTGGAITEVAASHCKANGLSHVLKLGDCVEVSDGQQTFLAEAVRIDQDAAILKSFEAVDSLGLDAHAWRKGAMMISPSLAWKGRVIDALGQQIDGRGQLLQGSVAYAVDRDPPAALKRQRVRTAVQTGVTAVDVFTPFCLGQRIGIFAGSGVGKSTLLAMMAGARGFDTVVVALVGERGREVREFLDDTLGKDRARTIAVVSTGNESPMMRRLAPRTAMCIAEFLRDQGENVLLIADSITRYAHAAREVALAAGEPPVARGYPPSVFTDLPKLLERAGPGEEGSGSITGIFSVLVDGDNHNEPVSDIVRGIVDGHIVLQRSIADQGRYPAIDVLASISRLAREVWSADEQKLVLALKNLISRFEESRDLRAMGGYQHGADPELDKATVIVPKLYDALKQAPGMAREQNAFQEISKALKT